MQLFQYHVFVCDQQKPEGVPCCSARGGAAVIDALRAEVGRQGLGETVQITMCGSLGLCERGPNMVVYPEGTWYSGRTAGRCRRACRESFPAGSRRGASRQPRCGRAPRGDRAESRAVRRGHACEGRVRRAAGSVAADDPRIPGEPGDPDRDRARCLHRRGQRRRRPGCRSTHRRGSARHRDAAERADRDAPAGEARRRVHEHADRCALSRCRRKRRLARGAHAHRAPVAHVVAADRRGPRRHRAG